MKKTTAVLVASSMEPPVMGNHDHKVSHVKGGAQSTHVLRLLSSEQLPGRPVLSSLE